MIEENIVVLFNKAAFIWSLSVLIFPGTSALTELLIFCPLKPWCSSKNFPAVRECWLVFGCLWTQTIYSHSVQLLVILLNWNGLWTDANWPSKGWLNGFPCEYACPSLHDMEARWIWHAQLSAFLAMPCVKAFVSTSEFCLPGFRRQIYRTLWIILSSFATNRAVLLGNQVWITLSSCWPYED